MVEILSRSPLVVLAAAACLVAGCGGDDDFSLQGGGADGGPLTDASAADGSLDATTAAVDAAVDGGAADAGAKSEAGVAPLVQPFVTDGPVEAMLHVGSSWYLGGGFARITTYPTNDLISLDTTGTPAGCFRDPSFTGYEGGPMVQVGGSLYIGGWQRTPNGILKVDLTSCAIDPSFHPTITSSVEALATDGASLFVAVPLSAHGQGDSVVKLDAQTGALDTSFAAPSGIEGGITVLLHASSALYVAAGFVENTPIWPLVKLDPVTGIADPAFNPTHSGFDQPIRALVATSTSLYAGGQFTEYGQVVGSAAGLAKLDLATGELDPSFGAPNTNLLGCGPTSNGVSYAGGCDANEIRPPNVWALAVSGTSLFVGGSFNLFRGAPANDLAKVDLETGELDTTFDPPAQNGFDPDGEVYSLTPSGSTLYVGGWFTGYRGALGNAFSFAKLDLATGVQDTTFLPAGSDMNGVSGYGPTVGQILVAGDSVILGGTFNTYGGQFANGVAKLDDVTFQVDRRFQPFSTPYTDSEGPADAGQYLFDAVTSLGADGDALYIGGGFIGPAPAMAKVDLQTGALDPSFASPFGPAYIPPDPVLAVAGSSVYAYSPDQPTTGLILKIDPASGQADPSFGTLPDGGPQSSLHGTVTSVAVSADSVYLGGSFSDGSSAGWRGVVKISAATGALDTTFSPAGSSDFSLDGATVDPSVDAVLVSGSSLYVGGAFTSYRGAPANNLAKLDLATGALDTAFSPPGANGFDQPVTGLAGAGSALYALGAFTTYRGSVPTPHVAKLDATSGAAFPGYASAATGAGATGTAAVTGVTAIGVSGTGALVSTALGPAQNVFYAPLTPLAP